MKKDESFRDYLLHDLLADVYDVEIRAMMGGNMIRKSWLAVGILEDGVVYFKVWIENMADYDAVDARYFTYQRNGQEVSLRFREIPVDVLEDRDLLKVWLDKAYLVARNAPKKSRKPRQSDAS